MIRHIFFKELQIALLNKRLTASCLALVILMVVGGVVFEKRYRSMQREYEEFMMQEGQSIDLLIKSKQKDVDEAIRKAGRFDVRTKQKHRRGDGSQAVTRPRNP